jgi:hypothetical protein
MHFTLNLEGFLVSEHVASGKTIVFGIFKREGKVYTKMVPNASKKTLLSIIRGKVALESAMAGMATMVWWTWDMTNTTECIISHDESTRGYAKWRC